MTLGLPSTLPPGATVRQLLASGGRSYSFEFFPPKTDAGEATLWANLRQLECLHPTFVSVTYGAGGTTRDRTVRITQRISEDTSLPAVGHLTCVGSSADDVRSVVGAYAAAGVRNILALRGDPPGGPRSPWQQHPQGLAHADELVTLIKGLGDFCVGVAAFPDVHPESPDLDHDARVLAAKAAAGADFAVTQFIFEVEPYLRLVERVRALGCDIPIIPGIMPVTNVAQIRRFAELSGTPVPGWLATQLDEVRDDDAAVRQVGVAAATELCAGLLDAEAPGLHFYTLNRSTATREIYAALGLGATVAAGRSSR